MSDLKQKETKTVKIEIPKELRDNAELQLSNLLGFNGDDGTYLYHRKSPKNQDAKIEDFTEIQTDLRDDLLDFIVGFAMQCLILDKAGKYQMVKEVKTPEEPKQ